MTEEEKMLAGKLYMPTDSALRQKFYKSREFALRYNQTSAEEEELRTEILQNWLGKIGENVHIEPPFHCDYGCHISLGNNFYANFDLVALDVAEIVIGDNVLIAPKVGLYTATHPIDPTIRATGLEYGKKIVIGNNVWIGGSTVINPGVTIGDNSVIGSGSVVTHDIPPNVVAVGNPCRVLRPITKEDFDYWDALRKEYFDAL